MKNVSEEHMQLLAEVAQLYYESNLDQSEIAHRRNISRSSVSRLLTEARELEVVEFRINFPIGRHSQLEETLKENFQINDVYVLDMEKVRPVQMLNRLARLANLYLEPLLTDGKTIGLTWGTTLHEITTVMSHSRLANAKVVQVIGSSTSNENLLIDGIDLVQQFASKLGAENHYLHAPLMVADNIARDALIEALNVKQTLDLARQADVLVTGIGSIDPEYSAPLRAGYVTREDLIKIVNTGGVGEFCGYHINLNGELIDISLNQAVIGISLDDISNIPLVMGVGGGRYKAQTILGVLRGQLLNVLITDEEAANEVIRLAGIQ
jgi:deoxyribonucleoside regulator